MANRNPDYHHPHVRVRKDRYDRLKAYCEGGAQRIYISDIIEELLRVFVDNYVNEEGLPTWESLPEPIHRSVKEAAPNIHAIGYPTPPKETPP